MLRKKIKKIINNITEEEVEEDNAENEVENNDVKDNNVKGEDEDNIRNNNLENIKEEEEEEDHFNPPEWIHFVQEIYIAFYVTPGIIRRQINIIYYIYYLPY